MNVDALRLELEKADYAGLDETATLAKLNAATVPATRNMVPLWELKKAALETGAWPAIVAGQAHADPTAAACALTAAEYINDDRFENLDFGLTSMQTVLGALRAYQIITQPQADAFAALQTLPNITPAQACGAVAAAESVCLAHLRRARST